MRDSPCVLALPPLAVVLVVQPSDSLTQRLDTGRRAIFSSMARDIDLLGPLEAALYVIVDFGCTLAQVGPFFGLLEESVFVLSSCQWHETRIVELIGSYCLLRCPVARLVALHMLYCR